MWKNLLSKYITILALCLIIQTVIFIPTKYFESNTLIYLKCVQLWKLIVHFNSIWYFQISFVRVMQKHSLHCNICHYVCLSDFDLCRRMKVFIRTMKILRNLISFSTFIIYCVSALHEKSKIIKKVEKSTCAVPPF